MSAVTIILVALALGVLIVASLVLRRILLDLREERRRGLNLATSAETTRTAGRPKLALNTLSALLFGFGGGLAFLIGYLVAPVHEEEKIFFATAVFMVATLFLTLASRVTQQKLWPLRWSALLVVTMGGLTLWLHDETFIKIRPTLFYAAGAGLAAVAFTGHSRLEAIYRDELNLDPTGRRKITLLLIGWGSAMALLNEIVWRTSSDLFWIGFQIWGPILGTFLFLGGSVPAIRRHGFIQCKVRASE